MNINELITYVNIKVSSNSDLSKEFRHAIPHIEVEKWLNTQYPLHLLKKLDLKITLISKGSGGFGDVIWGVRAIKALLDVFPNAQISVISDALDKFKQVNATEGVSSQVELIKHDDKGKVTNSLAGCDLAIDGPYPNGMVHLFDRNFKPLEKLIQSRRLLTGIEYDRGDYDSKWWKEKKPSTFISGIGDNAYGIFIVDELKKFLESNKFPLSPPKKSQLIDQLQDQALKKVIQDKASNGKYPLYFGYGYERQKEFIEVILQFESAQKKEAPIVIVLLSASGTGLDEKGLVNSLKKNQPKNIGSISTCTLRYRKSDQELHQIAERYSEFGITYESLKAGQSNFPDGQNFMIRESKLVKFSGHGRDVYIIKPSEGLVKSDMTILHKIGEPISMLTGDQSLSEGISMGKLLLYDPRKVESLQWIVRLAKRNKLNLIADYFDAFTFKNDVEKVVKILADPKLEEEKRRLFELCHKRNLAVSLQQMVSRRLFNLKTGFKTETLEDTIHECFDESSGVNQKKLEGLAKNLSDMISKTDLPKKK